MHDVLILTPIKDALTCLDSYFTCLENLSYPHANLSLGLMEGDSEDGSFERFSDALTSRLSGFAEKRIWKQDFGFRIPNGKNRWDSDLQLERRSVLAKSRNHLLSRALRDQDFVLWLDVDVIEYPADVVQQLLEVEGDIVHPHCVKEYGGPTFDRNAWRDQGAKVMQDLRREGDQVELHAVGGTMLLVKADLHREGLVFPPFPFGRSNELVRKDNKCHPRWQFLRAMRGEFCGEIETEGLGIMAHEMGYKCIGLPHLEIRHRDE